MKSLSQKERVLALCLDLILLFSLCKIGFDSFVPLQGDKGFWFYAALLNVVVGSKLTTPFYIKPVDAITYALPAFIALMLVTGSQSWDSDLKTWFSLLVLSNVAVVILALASIIFNNSSKESLKQLADKARTFLELVAKPQFIYVPLVVFSVFAYHQTSTLETTVILLALAFTVVVSIGEKLVRLFNLIRQRIYKPQGIVEAVGELVAYQQPCTYLLCQLDNRQIKLGSVLYVKEKDLDSKLLLALDYVGQENGMQVRSIQIASFARGKYQELESRLSDGVAVLPTRDMLSEIVMKEELETEIYTNVIGIVTSESTIQRIFIEVVNNSGLESGRLVSVIIGHAKILYQIVEGYTKEDIVHQKNTYGYVRVQAQQIGEWDLDHSKFKQYAWLPMMNSPVHLEEEHEYEISESTVGHLPKSNYKVGIGDISQLVTHNTAILGILGVGKTMLAIELLERMMATGIKVVCLDLTNQYATELRDYYDEANEVAAIQRIIDASNQDRNEIGENPDEGGSRPNLKEAIYEDLKAFIESSAYLKIYNPAAFVATRQDRAPTSVNQGGAWSRLAALYSVTPVEVTQIVSEALLDILSAEMSDTAKVCIVYEEAHSLVPEWNSVVADTDKNATSGTARAILQGRKFGLGCLLITQRTANVTKTILNQCNTIFAMRTFDDTGKDFLSSYIGKDYASTLSTLKERHAVFFGRGSSCENPVLMKVNDRAEFKRIFRANNPVPTFTISPPGSGDDAN